MISGVPNSQRRRGRLRCEVKLYVQYQIEYVRLKSDRSFISNHLLGATSLMEVNGPRNFTHIQLTLRNKEIPLPKQPQH